VAVYCFIVHGPDIPRDPSATTSYQRVLCGVALWCWGMIASCDRPFVRPTTGTIQRPPVARLWGSGNSSVWIVAKVLAWLLERQSL
jgi:hypothetical protein